jgi:hypothetical protein
MWSVLWSALSLTLALLLTWHVIGTVMVVWRPYRPSCIVATWRAQTRRRFVAEMHQRWGHDPVPQWQHDR